MRSVEITSLVGGLLLLLTAISGGNPNHFGPHKSSTVEHERHAERAAKRYVHGRGGDLARWDDADPQDLRYGSPSEVNQQRHDSIVAVASGTTGPVVAINEPRTLLQ